MFHWPTGEPATLCCGEGDVKARFARAIQGNEFALITEDADLPPDWPHGGAGETPLREHRAIVGGTQARRTTAHISEFFADLDRQRPAERGAHGEPSTNDFQVFELLVIVERFDIGLTGLPELIPGRSDYRVEIATGVLLCGHSVVGQLAPDGAVELVAHEIDPDNDWS